MAALNRKMADGAAVTLQDRPRCELERWLDTYGEGATGAAYGRMNLRNVYANGQQVAGLDEAGKIDVLSRLTGFSNTDAGKTQIVAQAGDTLRSLAQRVYGNGNLWYLLAEANGLGDDPNGELVAGTSLTVPEAKTSSNDANTFKPYSPSEITGPVEPALPYIPPPSDAGCSGIAMALMVVAMVVAAIVAPYALALVGQMGLTGALATGVATGLTVAAGSAVSQGIGSALGVASFSWRQVAVDGIVAGITAGAGQALAGTSTFGTLKDGVRVLNTAGRVLNGVVSYGGSVVANAAVGYDTNFSWNSVAATAVGAYLSTKVPGVSLMDQGSPGSGIVNGTANGIISGGIAATSRRLVGGGEQDWRQIAWDAFGNALANGLAQRAGDAARPAFERWAEGRGIAGGAPSQAGVGSGHISAVPEHESRYYLADEPDTVTLDTVRVTSTVNPYTGGAEYWVLFGANQWINAYQTRINQHGADQGPQVQRWSPPVERVKLGYEDYLAGGQAGSFRMRGVQTGSNRLPGLPASYYNASGQIEFKPLSLEAPARAISTAWNATGRLWDRLAGGYNEIAQSNAEWMASIELPLADKTLGQTGFGRRLISDMPRMPEWNGWGMARTLAPGITGWIESGFAMPDKPWDIQVGQWKSGGNLLSGIVEGGSRMSPLGQLVYYSTGYRFDGPRWELTPSQQLGGATFDGGLAALTLVAPEVRAGQLAGGTGRLGRVANSVESGAVRLVDPAKLRWTQTTAGGNGRASIWRDRLDPSSGYNAYPLEPIDVVNTADGLVTVDHTRAAVALEYGTTEIPVRVYLPDDLLPVGMTSGPRPRFGPSTTWGEAAAYRASRQVPPLPPTGTTTPPKLPRRK
jgi:hypothetical protein